MNMKMKSNAKKPMAVFALLAVTLLAIGPAAAQNGGTPAEETLTVVPSIAPIAEAIKDVGDVVRMGSSFTLKGTESCGDAVVMGGSAIMEGHGRGDLVVMAGRTVMSGGMDGDVVLIGTNAQITAPIGGDLVVIGGSAVMDSAARVGGAMVSVCGSIDAPENMPVGGERVEIAPMFGRFFGEAFNYVRLCVFKGRLAAPELPWTMAALGFLMIIGFFLSALFGKTFNSAVAITLEKPGMVLLAGALAQLVAGPVIVLLLATVIGIPVVPVLIIMLCGLTFIGCTALCGALGKRMFDAVKAPGVPMAVSVLLVSAVVFGLSMLPWIGGVVLTIVITFGTGSGVLACIEQIRANRKVPPAQGGSGSANVPLPAATVVSEPPVMQMALPESTAANPKTTGAAAEVVAGMWQRLVAALIDMLLVFAVYSITFGAVLSHGGPFAGHADGPVKVLLLIIYLAVMWSWKGTTVGNIVFHLKVCRTDGTPLTAGVSVVRALGLILSLLPLGLGFFWIQWDAQGQSWHDKIAGTKVVKLEKGISLL